MTLLLMILMESIEVEDTIPIVVEAAAPCVLNWQDTLPIGVITAGGLVEGGHIPDVRLPPERK